MTILTTMILTAEDDDDNDGDDQFTIQFPAKFIFFVFCVLKKKTWLKFFMREKKKK